MMRIIRSPQFSVAHLLLETLLFAVALALMRLVSAGPITPPRMFLAIPLMTCLGAGIGGLISQIKAGTFVGLLAGIFVAMAMLLGTVK